MFVCFFFVSRPCAFLSMCLHLRECARMRAINDVTGDRYCFTVAFIPFVLQRDVFVCAFLSIFRSLGACLLNAFPLIIDFLTLGLGPKTLKDARTKLHANQMRKSIFFCHFRCCCCAFFALFRSLSLSLRLCHVDLVLLDVSLRSRFVAVNSNVAFFSRFCN